MRLEGRRGPLGWWSPNPRGVLPLDSMRVTRSLRISSRHFDVTVDQDFEGVMAGCADKKRPAGWIGKDFAVAYARLHHLGYAHSVEVRGKDDGELAGGLYGISLGGLFAGESMFHRRTDASKVALMALVEMLTSDGVQGRLLDVQWTNPHLRTLGAVDISRSLYLERLASALALPSPSAFVRSRTT
jgi:leucyl/phenylalanyl-tRNA--protein transferase